jgi:hypothetical protein
VGGEPVEFGIEVLERVLNGDLVADRSRGALSGLST